MAGIYLHIPFCKTRCLYCDFFSSSSKREKASYIEALAREMELRKDYLQGQEIDTIYFGGGTPSQLSADDYTFLFEQLKHYFPFDDQTAEITLEANPDDLTDSYLAALSRLPFNRLSIGIQSFDDPELLFLNRRHTADAAIAAVERAQRAGFANISIDLMYGLPGQTLDGWHTNILQATKLGIQHISAYHLIYEAGTTLFRMLEEGKVHPTDEELSLEMFNRLIDSLSDAGFEHYEISNFALPGFRSRHNSAYWQGKHYLGLGAAAHSYNGTSRQWNACLKGADYLAQAPEIEMIDQRTAYNDYILTRIRTADGADLDELERLFGEKMKTYCLRQAEKYLSSKLLQCQSNRLVLTRQGIFLSDGIMSDLMSS